jgi:hypothetical protein
MRCELAGLVEEHAKQLARPSILPGAFAITSSRTARDVCSLTVRVGLS